MPLILLAALLAVLVYLPSLWVRRVMAKYDTELSELPGTGGELATHLITRFGLEEIQVEETGPLQDHFDPSAKKVRLSPSNFKGKSLTAVAVAAHEVGHAMQFHRKEKIFELRKRYLPLASTLSKAGIGLMMVLPIFGFVVKIPAVIGTLVAVSLLLQLAGAMAYLIILPEEWDASFNKALPLLIAGEYIDQSQIPAVRQILKAAAFTYFAQALASVLNIGRWLLILRR